MFYLVDIFKLIIKEYVLIKNVKKKDREWERLEGVYNSYFELV